MWWEGFAHSTPPHLKLAHDYSEFIKIFYGQDQEKNEDQNASTSPNEGHMMRPNQMESITPSNSSGSMSMPSMDSGLMSQSVSSLTDDQHGSALLMASSSPLNGSIGSDGCGGDLKREDSAGNLTDPSASQHGSSNEYAQRLYQHQMMQQMMYYQSMYPWMDGNGYGSMGWHNQHPSSAAALRSYRNKRSRSDLMDMESGMSGGGYESKKIVQGQVSVPIKAPLPEHTARRREVEAELAETMSDQLFNLKCKIYRRELSNVIAEFALANGGDASSGSASDKRTHIPQFASLPELELNAMEKQYLVDLGEYAYSDELLKVMDDECPNQFGKTMGMVFQELLNSVSNRLLFLIMVEYRSWFPQDRARIQIVKVVEKALWQGMEEEVKKQTELVKYVESFVIQRSKNYRDVISRVTKRIRT